MIRAILIQPGTTGQVDELPGGDDLESLQAFQRIIGGHFEAVYSSDHKTTFYHNADGKGKRLRANLLATQLWWDSIGGRQHTVGGFDVIHGPVIICGGPAFGSESTSVTSEMEENWKRLRSNPKIDWSPE